jgi:hypothetical protein
MFNLQGVVDVLVDVNGYYADHNHDDRYDTKAQVDGKIEASIIGIGNGEPGDPLELAVETKDRTVRDSAGCFEITPDADTAARRTHHLMLFVIDDVQIGEVTATWTAA